MFDNMKKVRFLCEAAIIAAMYTALTLINPWSSGQIQVRVSEALTILPFFTPAAIPGLFVGCLFSNIFGIGGAGILDIIFGSLASLIAAYATYKMPNKVLAPLPPVIVNAVIVAAVWKVADNAPFIATMGFVALGELIACYALGYPLLLLLKRYKVFNKPWHVLR